MKSILIIGMGKFGHHLCADLIKNGNDIMVYHARTETEIIGDPLYNPNRHAMLMPVRWGKDGAPVFEFS